VHNDQQQKIAKFLPKMRIVVCTCGLAHFVCFLDQRRQQRLVRLLSVPWATAGTAQLRDNLAELREMIGDL
jgi:hypothetical protein